MLYRGLALSLSLAALAGCGSEASLVGGECADGFVFEGGACVVPKVRFIDPGAPPVPTPPSSGTTSGTNATMTGPSFGTGTVTNPGVAIVDPVDPVDPLPPLVDPVIDPVDPIVPPEPLVCASPLVECAGACISVESDPTNCGACGKQCPSNICVAGLCQGATPGDVVLVGHAYKGAASMSAQAKVLVNALSIATSNPVRVLSFEKGGNADNVLGARTVADGGLRAMGRRTKITTATKADDLASPTLINSYDAIVIHGVEGDPAALAAQWRDALGTFTQKGGIVVAIDDGSTPMPQLLTQSGLLTVGGHTTLADGAHLLVSAAADAVGTQVLSPYAPFGAPISFQGVAAESADVAWVVRTDTDGAAGDAVVVHRVVR